MLGITVALIVFLAPLAYSPGPGNLFFAASAARFGLRATWPANLGYHAATWGVTLSIGLGFAALMKVSPLFFSAIKWGGVAYVCTLSAAFFRAGRTTGAAEATPAGFLGGAVLLVLNPKAYLIIAMMFSQFLALPEVSRPLSVAWITTVFTLNNFIAFLVWMILGDRISARFRNDRDARRLNTGFGLALAGVAGWLALA
ncbi:Transporter, LysE family [Rhodovulum sp. P5]|uniref:LysE family translocator n=1 Tax=Rhodovulum sp. P5 TaxID=1564506 RepID=UPI0009C2C729|nr:LysE family translocator [Rhodovulum sp. P5]ARE39540.1 Transporter, LysE family [Rhodovulum sp. P5]